MNQIDTSTAGAGSRHVPKATSRSSSLDHLRHAVCGDLDQLHGPAGDQPARSVGGVLFSVSAGKILQLTHSYVALFGISASTYLISMAVLRVLAPGLKRVDFTT